MVQRCKLTKVNWDEFQHLCSTRLHQSAMNDADDPMSLFISILKDIAEETIPKTRQYHNINYGFPKHAKMQSESKT